ncbi:uncharacterized protein LOC113549638 [Rhopalosiphum maidis]|uniref:uncharacterized protein LOC113549638 n=1 Tax=Rhopalosiphum maidis TaxID=43146 RepID=UPI000EFE660F|nr:uncharacterized protein LOC113549638 [Rhopalosiphum maidis]
MRKIILLFAMTATMVAAFGVVPTAAKKQKEDRGAVKSTDENGNDVDGHGVETANEYDSQRFPVMYVADESTASTPEPTAALAKTSTKQPSNKLHNAKLLNKLGMKRVRTSGSAGDNGVANHHRKRLASQSRSKYAADGKGGSDSQMFIVKLPPHSHFYDDGSAVRQRLGQPHQQTPYKNMNTVPVGFVSNGKPAKVYHWNLPTIKHALSGGGRYKGVNNLVPMQHQQQQIQQQMHHLQYAQAGDFELPSAASSKILPRRTLYYKPRAAGKPVKKSFVNNGKPNGFYVVSSKNSAAAVPQYHKIIKAYYGSGDD